MKKKTRTLIVSILLLLVLIIVLFVGTGYYCFYAPQFYPKNTVSIYIDRDDTVDSVFTKVKSHGLPRCFAGFKWMAALYDYDKHVHTGHYSISPEENVYTVFSRFNTGQQEPVNLTIPSVRTLDRLAGSVSRQLMIDSVEIVQLLGDTTFQHRMGYNQNTMACLFIPNTYQVYWNMSVERFFERVQAEHNRFWNDERKNKAKTMGMTLEEVCTLASIVEEETNNNAEKPMVAGLYMNRLHRRIPLQADPTIKFALQEFGLRRILNAHLKVDSPYNTYRHIGLPPGPIRIPTPVGIDAVLNYVHHNYIYMCAKEDFSGTHNFSSTYSEHLKNARKYRAALNKRKIFS